MIINECFYELKTPCSIYDQIAGCIDMPDAKWFNQYSFDILVLPEMLIRSDPVMAALYNEFDIKSTSPVFLKMGSNLHYKFHKDTVRTCAINMLMTGWDSHSFWGRPYETGEDLHHIKELKYKPRHYYLIDTKTEHAVLNFNEPRVVFTLGFNPPYTFDIVKEFIMDNNL